MPKTIAAIEHSNLDYTWNERWNHNVMVQSKQHCWTHYTVGIMLLNTTFAGNEHFEHIVTITKHCRI